MTPTIATLQSIGDATFTVKGYQRSDGAVVNLTVKFLPHDGYKNLIRESIETIDKFGDLLDKTQFVEVRDNVLVGLNKSLADKSEDANAAAPSKRQSHEELEFIARNIAILDKNPDKVAVFNLETIATEMLVEPAKVVKSRDELSANKKKLMAVLPVSRYCHRLNLYPGKYQSVEL
jgi:hypothetical protein